MERFSPMRGGYCGYTGFANRDYSRVMVNVCRSISDASIRISCFALWSTVRLSISWISSKLIREDQRVTTVCERYFSFSRMK